jgi:hypothetical protein
MRRRFTGMVLLTSVIVAAFYVGNALATAPVGFVGSTIAVGRFSDIDALNQYVAPNTVPPSDIWLSLQRTKGLSDLYVQSNVWAPGGSTGWHTHPGHSLIIVTQGTVTAYEGDDHDCKPTVYTQGMGFLDPGGSHVHNLRNEDAVEARTVAVQIIPAGAARRIDASYGGPCRF